MFTDVAALTLAWAGLALGRTRRRRAATRSASARAEVLAAFVNAELLLVASALILWEAWQRLRAPGPIHTDLMLGVAVVGLAVNVAAARLLHAGRRGSLGVRAAYLEVLTDALASLAVIVAAIVMARTALVRARRAALGRHRRRHPAARRRDPARGRPHPARRGAGGHRHPAAAGRDPRGPRGRDDPRRPLLDAHFGAPLGQRPHPGRRPERPRRGPRGVQRVLQEDAAWTTPRSRSSRATRRSATSSPSTPSARAPEGRAVPQTPHMEHHFTASDAVRDVVIGMSDGLTVPVRPGGGPLGRGDGSSGIIVTAGLAEIAAGSIAMGLGGYLAGRSDAEHYASERRARAPRSAGEALRGGPGGRRDLPRVWPFGQGDRADSPGLPEAAAGVDRLHDAIRARASRSRIRGRALRSALTIGAAYAAGGLIPLGPYILLGHAATALSVSIGVTLAALAVFGFVKGRFTGARPWKSAFQTTLIGGVAAAAASRSPAPWARCRAFPRAGPGGGCPRALRADRVGRPWRQRCPAASPTRASRTLLVRIDGSRLPSGQPGGRLLRRAERSPRCSRPSTRPDARSSSSPTSSRTTRPGAGSSRRSSAAARRGVPVRVLADGFGSLP